MELNNWIAQRAAHTNAKNRVAIESAVAQAHYKGCGIRVNWHSPGVLDSLTVDPGVPYMTIVESKPWVGGTDDR